MWRIASGEQQQQQQKQPWNRLLKGTLYYTLRGKSHTIEMGREKKPESMAIYTKKNLRDRILIHPHNETIAGTEEEVYLRDR